MPFWTFKVYQESGDRAEEMALETERLIIRPFTLSDIDDVHREVYTSENVWGPKTREYVTDSVTMAMLMSRSPDDAPWAKRAVIRKEDSAFLGQVRLGPSHNYFYRWEEEPNPPCNPVEVELSFAFGESFWGQSYAYEASVEMVRYAFEDLRLPRLLGGTGSDNLRSIQLHKRLGYRIYPALTLEGKPDDGGIVAVLNNTMS
ncbi:MAG: GNAT family N-acetyltransferase [Armatimonas sp.]